MALMIEKGGKPAGLATEKSKGGIKQYVVGMGWTTEADLDVAGALCRQGQDGADAKIVGEWGFCYWGQQDVPGLHHCGDILSGKDAVAGQDVERIEVDLDALPPTIDQLDFWATIYHAQQLKQSFGGVTGAFLRVYPSTGRGADGRMVPGPAMVEYNLASEAAMKSATGMQFASIYKDHDDNDAWKVQAIGSGAPDLEIGGIIRSYGVQTNPPS